MSGQEFLDYSYTQYEEIEDAFQTTLDTSLNPRGYDLLLDMVGELGQVGIEGTGSYGAGLARWLRARSVSVIEVDRPDRRTRRRRGKSDTVYAEAAARAVLAGIATAEPKAGTGPMEMVRALRVARQSALKARTQAANELHALVVTAPEAVRAELRQLRLAQLVSSAAAFRPSKELTHRCRTMVKIPPPTPDNVEFRIRACPLPRQGFFTRRVRVVCWLSSQR